MGGLWPWLAGSISQLALLASTLGWVCPAWQIRLAFLLELFREQQAPGGGGKPSLPGLDHITRGSGGQSGGPLEDPGLTQPDALPTTSQLLERL